MLWIPKSLKGKSYGPGSFSKENNRVCIHCCRNTHTIDTCYAKYGFSLHVQRKSANHTSTGGNDKDMEISSQVLVQIFTTSSITYE